MGGLIVSTIFTLVLVPTLFSLLMTWREALCGLVVHDWGTVPGVAAGDQSVPVQSREPSASQFTGSTEKDDAGRGTDR